MSAVPGVHIFQIYYSAATRAALDPGFLPLDNLENARPDWREYWPIRHFLQQQAMVPGDYYGFLSPAFKNKTGLAAGTVIDFVKAQNGAADVVLFSPFFDQIAFFLNQWEQGAMTHRTTFAFEQALPLIAPTFGIYNTVSSSRDSVFCNYFVAKSEFWREWLERCERVFHCAESAATPLGRAFAEDVYYGSQRTPTKVFIIERVVSALLATERRWSVKAYNPVLLPFSHSPVAGLGAELAALDALKIAYQHDPQRHYTKAFFELRAKFAAAQRQAASAAGNTP